MIEKQMRKLLRDCRKIGISQAELREIPSFKEIYEERDRRREMIRLFMKKFSVNPPERMK